MPLRHLARSRRGASFQLPRQELSSADVTVRSSFESPRGYARAGEHKRGSPSPERSLLEFLRDRRSPDIEPKAGSDTEFIRAEEAATAADDEFMEHDHDHDHDTAPPHSLRPRSARIRAGLAAEAHAVETASSTDAVAVAVADGALGHGVKRSRYLRESDRRDIIRRIDCGEKQAALAKEFGVTRAAICHINKNRVEIMTRSARSDVHAAARHPKRGMYTTSKSSCFLVDGRTELPMVYEVRSLALAVHMTALRHRDTSCRQYRAMADRAFRVLLEEALAAVPTRQVEIVTPSDALCQGVVGDEPTCAIFMSECGYPMLEAFRCIHPDSPTGFMTLDHEERADPDEPPRVTLRKMCTPLDLLGHNIFLLDATCATGREALVAIQSLVDFGADEASIFFVTLVISAAAVTDICERFPQAHIVTAAIDAEVTCDLAIRPGIGSFQERYFNTTTIRQSDHGSNVEL